MKSLTNSLVTTNKICCLLLKRSQQPTNRPTDVNQNEAVFVWRSFEPIFSVPHSLLIQTAGGFSFKAQLVLIFPFYCTAGFCELWCTLPNLWQLQSPAAVAGQRRAWAAWSHSAQTQGRPASGARRAGSWRTRRTSSRRTGSRRSASDARLDAGWETGRRVEVNYSEYFFPLMEELLLSFSPVPYTNYVLI